VGASRGAPRYNATARPEETEDPLTALPFGRPAAGAHQSAPALAPSAVALDRFVTASPGLREPRIARKVPGLLTLPELKDLARDRRAEGHFVLDQSAGDIDEVGQPLAPAFLAWIPEARQGLIAAGVDALRPVRGQAYDFTAAYQRQYPKILDAIGRSFGIRRTPFAGLQTLSGRNVLDFTLRGLLARAGDPDRPALILDPLAWSGYRPLARDLGITLVHLPALPGNGLGATAAGLTEALDFAVGQGLQPIGALSVVPSNPSGVGIEASELRSYVETAAARDVPVLLDAFYSPLAPEGHADAVHLGWLERVLAPEALALLGVVVGETKVTSSQNKTASLIWMAPAGHEAAAGTIVATASARMTTTNSYPRPREALVAWALHTFAGGVHAAMGPRYDALDQARHLMRSAADDLGLPLSIGGSFYGTLALVDADGASLIRDEHGRPVTDPAAISQVLIERFGLVGAPGPMFSSAPEAACMLRLTAAVSLEEVTSLRRVFERLQSEAG